MTTPPYQTGALQNVKTSSNFLAPYDVIMPQKENKVIYQYGRDYGLMLDIFGESKGSVNTTYDHYFEDRVRSKIKCSATTDTVDQQVTFTLHADAINTFPYNAPSPPFVSTATDSKKGYPVKKFDTLMIKPTSNVSADSMIYATVTAVNESANTFTALAQNATAIPTLTNDEVIVLYALGAEGGIKADPTVFTTTKVTNSMSTTLHSAEITHVADNLGYWIGNTGRWTMDLQNRHFQEFNRKRNMNWLVGNQVTNPALADWYSTNDYGTLFSGQGLFQEIWDRGNSFGYSGGTGPTIQWMHDVTDVMDKQKAAKVNLMCVGHTLRQKLEDLFNDYFQNGAITYGIFSGNQDKFVSFGFKRFEIDGYNFSLKTLDVMNDLQSFGAAGYPFPEEGFIQPDLAVNRVESDRKYNVGNPIRVRYQENEGGANTRLSVEFFDGKKSGDSGRHTKEIRMDSVSGIEMFCGNMWGWIPKE